SLGTLTCETGFGGPSLESKLEPCLEPSLEPNLEPCLEPAASVWPGRLAGFCAHCARLVSRLAAAGQGRQDRAGRMTGPDGPRELVKGIGQGETAKGDGTGNGHQASCSAGSPTRLPPAA